jgi:hypothetical protein
MEVYQTLLAASFAFSISRENRQGGAEWGEGGEDRDK